jgi:hypothetical protein
VGYYIKLKIKQTTMETLEKTHKTVDRPKLKAQYDHFIGGKWVKPANGEYFDNISPIDGKHLRKPPAEPKKILTAHWMQRIKLLRPGLKHQQQLDQMCC